MKYVVAVSGGIDSVVLLDKLVKQGGHELLVAHFDHGIRKDSAADARFVEAVAKKYSLPYFCVREELGTAASEELARKRRYAFLRRLAKKYEATIVTAHHADDIVETIAINILRGTGWRGLAVLGARDIERPLASIKKSEIYVYALTHRLEWVEDSTNNTNRYLRNRVRADAAQYLNDEAKEAVYILWQKQTACREMIEKEVARVLGGQTVLPRYFFTYVNDEVGVELLRQLIASKTGKYLLNDQLARGLIAIKTAMPGRKVQLGAHVELSFSLREFYCSSS